MMALEVVVHVLNPTLRNTEDTDDKCSNSSLFYELSILPPKFTVQNWRQASKKCQQKV